MRWETTAAMPEGVMREQVDPMPTAMPLERDSLVSLGVAGIQFGSLDRLFPPPCLNTDIVDVWDLRGRGTEPGSLCRVDERFLYLRADATRELPLAAGSLDWAYAEHFIEHITLEQARAWLREVRRILAPGGLLRVTTPDLRRYVDGYLDPTDAFYARHRESVRAMGLPAMETRKAWMLNQIFEFWGHRWIYDADELRHVLVDAGFGEVAVRAYREGRRADVAALDWEARRDETLYVEASS
jgi:predicted SAM-dependent methyltransferase